MTVAQFLGDKLVDFVTGLGGARDRTTTQSFGGQVQLLPLTEIETMYRSDWISRKLVDIVPQDMVREGRRWKIAKDKIGKIEKYEHRLSVNLWPKLKEALIRARLTGGACIFIGIDGADVSSELDPSEVQADGLKYLTVLDRNQISYRDVDRDPQSPYFGRPKMWQMTGGGTFQVDVHPSRMIMFRGPENLARSSSSMDTIWGDSLLQVVYEAVKNAASSQQHVAGLIPDARNDVIYIPGLGSILSNQKDRNLLTQRFAYAKQMKSMFNLLLLEGNGGAGGNERGEKWEQRQISFSNLPEIIRQFLQIVAGAADIPITRFLGESPGGENSTGEADMRNYYDHVKSLQRLVLTPSLQVLDEVIQRSAGVYADENYYEWSPLWALSETEKAEILEKKTKSARYIAGTGKDMPIANLFALSDALVATLVEDGSLPGLEEAVQEHGRLSESMAELPDPSESEEEPAEEPDPTAVVDAAPRTLYVRRDLKNSSELTAWAKKSGFEDIVPDMHVTIVYSRTAVDWIAMGTDFGNDELVVGPGGPRVVERLGPKATVLLFHSSDLRYRHDAMIRRGASSDYEDYVAHVTITNAPHNLDLENMVPFRGELRFGPEIFEKVKES